jgi:hypothetical protein
MGATDSRPVKFGVAGELGPVLGCAFSAVRSSDETRVPVVIAAGSEFLDQYNALTGASAAVFGVYLML